jgi:hypothetical protein
MVVTIWLSLQILRLFFSNVSLLLPTNLVVNFDENLRIDKKMKHLKVRAPFLLQMQQFSFKFLDVDFFTNKYFLRKPLWIQRTY